jgi:ATP-dependent exoDNAse (exonuclease V) beta subunit
MDMLRETEEGGIDDLIKLLKNNQTLNLLYVAMTRAKYQLTLPANVYDIFDNLEVLTDLWDKTASN